MVYKIRVDQKIIMWNNRGRKCGMKGRGEASYKGFVVFWGFGLGWVGVFFLFYFCHWSAGSNSEKDTGTGYLGTVQSWVDGKVLLYWEKRTYLEIRWKIEKMHLKSRIAGEIFKT